MGRGASGGGLKIKWECVCVLQDIQQHQRESPSQRGGVGDGRGRGAGVGDGRGRRVRGNKAKVYESKGTPNYSYTIHD